MTKRKFIYDKPFDLEGGGQLQQLEIVYQQFGAEVSEGKPIIWVCHALTADSNVLDWWKGLFGTGNLFDPADFTIICANILSSCYGSSSALSYSEELGRPWYHDFPSVTIRDIVRAHDLLRQELGIEQIELSIGGSTGGQQVLEWAIMQPQVFKQICILASNAAHSAWGRAFNETQRMAIAADQTWQENNPNAGKKGLEVARAIAMLSYRQYDTYKESQQDDPEAINDFRASSYQRYQGQKLSNRFDAFAYWRLSEAMDSHNVGRGRGSAEKALAQIEATAIIIAISSDVLFPPAEQELIAKHIPQSHLSIMDSLYGHDGFLIETEKITEILRPFITCKNS